MSLHGKKEELIRNSIPERTRELQEIIGAPVQYRVNLDSFNSFEALNFLDNVCLFRVSMSYRSIAIDDVGKQALHRIKHIDVSHAQSPSVELHGDVLVLRGDYARGLDGATSDNAITTYLNDQMRIVYSRKLHILRSKQLPDRTKEGRDILGSSDFHWEVDFHSLNTEGAVEFLDDLACFRVLSSFRGIIYSFHDLGQKAIRDGVKKVRIRNSVNPSDKLLKLEGGALYVTELLDRNDPSAPGNDFISEGSMEEYLIVALGLRVSQNLGTLRDKQIPEQTKELQSILGCPIQYDVDYSSFVTDQELMFVDNVSCFRVAMACRVMDGGTKGALAKKLKWVRLKNVTDPSAKKLVVENGALIMFCNYANGLNGAFSDGEIRDALTKYAG